MEAYSTNMSMLSIVGLLISLIFYAVSVVWKRARKYTWIFSCVIGFCFFTIFRHTIILLSYDDIADPNYERYKDWTIYRSILGDIICALIWFWIGVLVVRHGQLLQKIFSLVMLLLFLSIMLYMILLGVLAR